MKKLAMLAVCLFLFVGCSGEEQAEPPQANCDLNLIVNKDDTYWWCITSERVGNIGYDFLAQFKFNPDGSGQIQFRSGDSQLTDPITWKDNGKCEVKYFYNLGGLKAKLTEIKFNDTYPITMSFNWIGEKYDYGEETENDVRCTLM